ncbi:hypothetical protein ACWGCW_34440 [Streptomyces sp. NPDC054933]
MATPTAAQFLAFVKVCGQGKHLAEWQEAWDRAQANRNTARASGIAMKRPELHSNVGRIRVKLWHSQTAMEQITVEQLVEKYLRTG